MRLPVEIMNTPFKLAPKFPKILATDKIRYKWNRFKFNMVDNVGKINSLCFCPVYVFNTKIGLFF